MDGKLMVGYQGWFGAAGDGSGLGWMHYGNLSAGADDCTVDAWPDMTGAGSAERYPTGFRNADGSAACVFSSYNPATVDRHFRWMREHGIDGVFLQRFLADLRTPERYDFRTAVTDNVRDAANRNGRTWCVMYDLSGFDPERDGMELFYKDWRVLTDRMAVTRDPSYQHWKGMPLVALWGVGFPGRKYRTADVAGMVAFLKNDPVYGGNAVMLGVPFGWRGGVRDAVLSPELLELAAKADIVSPWSVGRYGTTEEFSSGLPDFQTADIAWCREKHVGYLPVIFPGFSWRNLMKVRKKEPGRAIPRGDGTFFRTQGLRLIEAGAGMLYVAMFDEMDEGTAIFKISNAPPAGQGCTFITNGEQVPDYFLRLSGELAGALRAKRVPSGAVPARGKE